jgi:hypothetical protein
MFCCQARVLGNEGDEARVFGHGVGVNKEVIGVSAIGCAGSEQVLVPHPLFFGVIGFAPERGSIGIGLGRAIGVEQRNLFPDDPDTGPALRGHAHAAGGPFGHDAAGDGFTRDGMAALGAAAVRAELKGSFFDLDAVGDGDDDRVSAQRDGGQHVGSAVEPFGFHRREID